METLKILGESGAATFGKGLGSVAASEQRYSQVIPKRTEVLTRTLRSEQSLKPEQPGSEADRCDTLRHATQSPT